MDLLTKDVELEGNVKVEALFSKTVNDAEREPKLVPKPKEVGLSEPMEATVVVSEPSEDATYEANLHSPWAHELEASEAHSYKCLDLNHLSLDPRQPKTSHGVALPPQQSEPSVETQPNQPLIRETKPIL
ncbi:hypothetical protein COCNU_03G005210 [Cocos nucifera]|uniref:Uncharacterized protein n=1 Tax=Cocos nucifera TaxID=13894 RepID=A0A8K0I216_COCNU|nr:hypothetical protein COCNU_03G005210 [Cocos nucifera]